MNYRNILGLVLIACCTSLSAQVDLSKFSASLKTKMAAEEQLASEKDPEFQELMSEGVSLFENNEFEMAIQKFEEAGIRRPINVYPPVMIEDVKLAMANYVEVEEQIEPEIEETKEQPKEPQLTSEERVEIMYQQELAKVYDKLPPKPKEKKPDPIEEPEQRDGEGLLLLEEAGKVDSVVEEEVESKEDESKVKTENPKKPVKETPVPVSNEKKEENPVKSLDEIQEDLAREYPDGVTEIVFQEGNRIITKRIVVKDGLGDEYRKVKHGWGGVFYFKNETSISERVWIEETSDN